MSSVNICGVLIHARRENADNVSGVLAGLPGVEVHASPGDGRLVVTVEGQTFGAMADTVSAIQNVGGVLSTSIVYHYSDDHHQDPKQESEQ